MSYRAKKVIKSLPPILANKSNRFLAKLKKDCLIRGEPWVFDWPPKNPGVFPPVPKRQHKRVLNRESRLKKIEQGLSIQPEKMAEYKAFLDSKRDVPFEKQEYFEQMLGAYWKAKERQEELENPQKFQMIKHMAKKPPKK